MTNFKELLFISDDSETANTIQCYDLQLGARIMTYKNGRGVSRRTLNTIGNDYLISAEISKPFLHIWSINKEESIKKMSINGKVTAMTISSNGIYCVCGIENKIYIWNIPTGQLLNVISYHHESITKIIFWNCSYLITSGADGLIAIWRLIDLLMKETGNIYSIDQFQNHLISISSPIFTSSNHSLPVTDMHLASCGNTARLFTVSADQTCQIYSIESNGNGRFIVSLSFDDILNSVIIDRLQRKLFIGTDSGRIISYSIESNYDGKNRYIDSSNDENHLIGHESIVNCLALSRDDNILASGSNDQKVILWNLSNHQQISIHQTFGHVTDLMFRVFSEEFLSPDLKLNCLISTFEKSVITESDKIEIRILVENELMIDDEFEKDLNLRKFFDCSAGMMPRERVREVEEKDSCDEIDKLRQQNRELRRINRRLYMYALDQCWRNGLVKD